MKSLRTDLIVRVWRWGQILGPMGSVGGLFLLLATCVTTWTWLQQQKIHALKPPEELKVALPQEKAAVVSSRNVSLPLRKDIPALLDSVRVAFAGAKVGWPEAEYKYFSLGDDSLAHVEVRTAFKATYPQVKALVAEIMDRCPSMGVRAWTMGRPNADAPELDVNMTWVVFFHDHRDDNPDAGGAP